MKPVRHLYVRLPGCFRDDDGQITVEDVSGVEEAASVQTCGTVRLRRTGTAWKRLVHGLLQHCQAPGSQIWNHLESALISSRCCGQLS